MPVKVAEVSSVDWLSSHAGSYTGRAVAVIGGAGFIGSHLVDALASLGAAVTVVDDFSMGLAGNLSGSPGVRVARLSITSDAEALTSALSGVQTVFHLAALVSVPRSLAEPQAYQRVNAGGTLAVLEASRRARVRRVVYSASSSAYGDGPALPKRESMPPLPRSPYAATKLAGEHLCSAYASCYPPMDAVSLRYFNIFGPRQRADSAYAGVIAAFATGALRGHRPIIYGDGSASRDFTYVANAVHANLLAGTRDKPFGGGTINVATGERRTVRELAGAVLRLCGREDLSPEHRDARAGDVPHSLGDLSHATTELGYAPVVSFEQGLRRTLDWYAQAVESPAPTAVTGTL